jgi:hypothetical protein
LKSTKFCLICSSFSNAVVLGSRVERSIVDGTCWSLDCKDVEADELEVFLEILKSDSCCWDADVGGGGGRVGDSPRCDPGERDRSCAI